MANTRVYEWSTTAASNTDINSNNIAEGCAPSGINNAIRELMRQVRIEVANQGSDIASAGTTDIGAATGQYVKVTGTTTITALGTVNAGTTRWVEFTGALTLTHNATSLKLPGSANITTANGDVACFVSLGSGNWKCLGYWPVDGSPVVFGKSSTSAGDLMTLTSSEAGAGYGPGILLNRNSASPAVNDDIGRITWRGKDDGGNDVDYAQFAAAITDPTNGSEDANIVFGTMRAGTLNYWVWGSGAQYHAGLTKPTTAGALNARELQVNNSPVAGPKYIIADQKTSGTNGGGITSGSFVKRTLNTEILDEIGITTSSSVMALSAGTYKAKFTTVCFNVDNFQARLRDTTNSVDLVLGTNADAPAGTNSHSTGIGYFVLSGSANVELQVRVTTTNATDGGGQATSFGTETYSIVELEKVA